MADQQARHPGSITAGVRDIVQRRIGDARAALRKQQHPADSAIHDARKQLKRARAGLRLLRGAIGKPAYVRENAALRDAARPLGRMRDAKVMLDAVERLLAREQQPKPRAVLLRLRRELRKARLSLRREVQRAGEINESARSLADAQCRIEKLPIRGAGPAVVLAGIESTYRKGRKALAAVHAECSDENLHELRKQAKYLGQALEILKPSKARGLAKLIKHAESMAERLGDDHDLVVLQDKLTTPPSGSQKAPRALHAQMQRRRKKLQAQALKEGRRLYKRKPQAFIKRFRSWSTNP